MYFKKPLENLFTEPDTDGEGLVVQACVEEAGNFQQGCERLPRLNDPSKNAGKCKISKMC
jgi:hypothetical protein